MGKRHEHPKGRHEWQVGTWTGKATVRYHYLRIRMAAVKTRYNAKCWQGCRETGLLSSAHGMQRGTITLKDSLAVPSKTEHATQQLRSWGIYSREMKTYCHTRTVHEYL